MALALESISLASRRIDATLATQNASPLAVKAFKALIEELLSRGVAELQVLPFEGSTIDTGSNGLVLLTSAVAKYYGIYAKRVTGSDVTAAFVEVLDDATDNTSAATTLLASLRTNAANEEQFHIFSNGEVLATGIVVSAVTAPTGATESAATESSYGFVIVGAA
jgi:hypothetical protein